MEVPKFDVIKRWKSHEYTFLVLSKMTRDLLTPSVSIVVSGYSFSIATNIIGDKRTTLTAKMLEALKDWEDGCMGLQTLEDELKKAFKKLHLKANNDV